MTRRGLWSGLVCVFVSTLGCGRIGFDYAADASPDAGVREPLTKPDMPADAARPPPDASQADDSGVRDSGLDPALPAPMDAGTLLDAGPDTAVPEPGTFCEDVVALELAPVIDGVLEAGLTLRRAPELGWTGARPLPSDQQAYYAVGYRPDGLYVFVSVVDSTPLPADPAADEYCGDGVELYVDADGMFPSAPLYDDPGTVQLIASSPADGAPSARRGSRWRDTVGLGAWAPANFASFATAAGYDLEAFVTAADLDLSDWTPQAGDSIGLSLSINVAVLADDADADCGRRLGQYFNRVTVLAPDAGTGCVGAFCTTDAFCVAPLLAP